MQRGEALDSIEDFGISRICFGMSFVAPKSSMKPIISAFTDASVRTF